MSVRIAPQAIVLGALALLAVLLLVAHVVAGGWRPAYRGIEGVPADVRAAIDGTVDAQLRAFHVPRETVRTRTVRGPGNRPFRIEQKAPVPTTFVTLQFNHALNLALAEHGARVVATERTRERVVTMHVVHDGAVVRSIHFALDPSLDGDDADTPTKGG